MITIHAVFVSILAQELLYNYNLVSSDDSNPKLEQTYRFLYLYGIDPPE